MILIFLALFFIGEVENPRHTYHVTVDKIEANTMHDDLGFPIFTQMIYWEKSYSDKNNWTWVVHCWSLNKNVWKKDDMEHRKLWMMEYRKLCDNRPEYRWDHADRKYKKFDPDPNRWPQKNYKTGLWSVIDRPNNRNTVIIYSPIFIETHTQYDPEIKNRDIVPEGNRKGLPGWKN